MSSCSLGKANAKTACLGRSKADLRLSGCSDSSSRTLVQRRDFVVIWQPNSSVRGYWHRCNKRLWFYFFLGFYVFKVFLFSQGFFFSLANVRRENSVKNFDRHFWSYRNEFLNNGVVIYLVSLVLVILNIMTRVLYWNWTTFLFFSGSTAPMTLCTGQEVGSIRGNVFF